MPDSQEVPEWSSSPRRLHSCQKGLKAGIYTDVGPKTCAEYEGSYQHDEQDAQTFASWGIDLIEEDFCHKPAGYTAAQLYTRMRDAIAHTGRPMLLLHLQLGWRTRMDVGAGAGQRLEEH